MHGNWDEALLLIANREPPCPPMEELATMRGAMWTARGKVPYGPRPNQDDNCICIDYFECFNSDAQAVIIDEYVTKRAYTDAPMGPIVDPGYHGYLPSTDWRSPAGFATYLDAAEKLGRAMKKPVTHFLRPDAGVLGLEWTVEDLDRELTPLFSTPRAQALMRKVCLGWEPGGKYHYRNSWWVEMCQWMARVFPKACRGIHGIADQDAPVGQDDDVRGDHGKPLSNGKAWANVAPYIHYYLPQFAGYVDGGSEIATPEYCKALQASMADLRRRFTTGGPDGEWPTFSAFGEGQRIRTPLGEDASYVDFWYNYPESESRRLGDLAVEAGADGSFDGIN